MLGTRGSALALWQARHVASRLESAHRGLTVEIRKIKTRGDVNVDVPLGQVGGKAIFVKEIETALLAGEIDLAAHSLKDMPSELPDGLTLASVLERHDPSDVLITRDGADLAELAPGTLLGTGSLRRQCQLLHARPDLEFAPVRGNVDTRLRKLAEGQFGGLVLARAGVERLGITETPFRPLPTSICLPAVGQGAVVIETRNDDSATRQRVETLNHADTERRVAAERAFLARLGGGCFAPATAHATLDGEAILVEGIVGSPDGTRLLRDRVEGVSGEEIVLGTTLAERLLAGGAEKILAAAREEGGEGA